MCLKLWKKGKSWMDDGNGKGLRLALEQAGLEKILPGSPTHEEEVLADQYARNVGLIAECARHPGHFYRCYSGIEAIDRIDSKLQLGQDRLLALIKRNDLQKKALIVMVMSHYQDECPQCKSA
jgi:hypothetical protein